MQNHTYALEMCDMQKNEGDNMDKILNTNNKNKETEYKGTMNRYKS